MYLPATSTEAVSAANQDRRTCSRLDRIGSTSVGRQENRTESSTEKQLVVLNSAQERRAPGRMTRRRHPRDPKFSLTEVIQSQRDGQRFRISNSRSPHSSPAASASRFARLMLILPSTLLTYVLRKSYRTAKMFLGVAAQETISFRIVGQSTTNPPAWLSVRRRNAILIYRSSAFVHGRSSSLRNRATASAKSITGCILRARAS
jgi:hypothetical protein